MSSKDNKPKPALLLLGDFIAYVYGIFPPVIAWGAGIYHLLLFIPKSSTKDETRSLQNRR